MRPGPSSSPSLVGQLLLAHPRMQDDNFRKSVILLSAHDPKGALGVVLNHPIGKTLGELSDNFADGPLAKIEVFNGGPVEKHQLLLCAWRKQEEGAGFQLMFGIDPAKAIELQANDGVHLRAFAGYSGWSAGQLENELKQDTWIVTPLIPNVLELQQDNTLWGALLGSVGPEWKLFADEPEDPSVN